MTQVIQHDSIGIQHDHLVHAPQNPRNERLVQVPRPRPVRKQTELVVNALCARRKSEHGDQKPPNSDRDAEERVELDRSGCGSLAQLGGRTHVGHVWGGASVEEGHVNEAEGRRVGGGERVERRVGREAG